jgi:hypothetical protein
MFTYDPRSSLRKDEQYLCQAIHQIAETNGELTCIAGSFPLTEILHQKGLPGFTSHDVNIFTTIKLTDQDINKLVRIVEKHTTDTVIEWYNNTDQSVDGRGSMVSNLLSIKDFYIYNRLDRNTRGKPKEGYKLQMISVLDSVSRTDYSKRNNRSFSIRTMQTFDISVCKCAIPDVFDVSTIITLALTDVMAHRMEYDMRKFTLTDITWGRLTKYVSRGFILTAFRFDDDKIIRMNENMPFPLMNGSSFDIAVVDDNTTSSDRLEEESDAVQCGA